MVGSRFPSISGHEDVQQKSDFSSERALDLGEPLAERWTWPVVYRENAAHVQPGK